MASLTCESSFASADWLIAGNTCLYVLAYFQPVLVKASVAHVFLMNFCGKPSIHHPP